MSSRRNPRPNGFKPPRVPSIQQPSASVRLPKVAGTYTPATLSEIWSVQEKADFNTCDRALRTAKKFACDLQRAAEIARETVAVSRTLIHHSQTGDHQSLDRGLALLDTMDDYHVEIADDVERMGDQIARLQVWFGAVREQVLASESVSNLPAPEDHRLSKYVPTRFKYDQLRWVGRAIVRPNTLAANCKSGLSRAS